MSICGAFSGKLLIKHRPLMYRSSLGPLLLLLEVVCGVGWGGGLMMMTPVSAVRFSLGEKFTFPPIRFVMITKDGSVFCH